MMMMMMMMMMHLVCYVAVFYSSSHSYYSLCHFVFYELLSDIVTQTVMNF